MTPSDPQGDLLSPAPQPGPAEVAALNRTMQQCVQDQLRLRQLVVIGLAGVVFLGLGVNGFMYKQTGIVRSQLGELQPQLLDYTSKFRQKEPAIRGFLTQLTSFAAANRDFQPVLMKYRTALANYFPTTAPVAAPAPVPGPAGK